MATLDAPGRLARLGAALVSTEPDDELQQIVARAAHLAETPIALVSLVMGHVQFFRARHGLPLDLQISCATSREDSFCQFVVQEEAVFVVTDASHDLRLPAALVQSYGIQSYAGLPIRLEGEVLGSLCVIDVKPRGFESATLASLAELAEQVSRRLATLSTRPRSRVSEPPAESPEELLARIEFHSELLDATLDELTPLLEKGREYGRSVAPIHHTRLRPMLQEATSLWPLLRSAVAEIEQSARRLMEVPGFVGAPRLLVAARAAERALIEVSPLVRLGESVLAQQIDLKTAARAGAVLSEALLFHRSMKASLGELRTAANEARTALDADRGAA
jgi:hypothetical protein